MLSGGNECEARQVMRGARHPGAGDARVRRVARLVRAVVNVGRGWAVNGWEAVGGQDWVSGQAGEGQLSPTDGRWA